MANIDLNNALNNLNNAIAAYGASLNYKNQKKAVEYQKEINEKQLDFSNTQLQEGIRQFESSSDWVQKEATRNQFNLEHQITNLVTDAQRNGINPLAVVGSSAGSGSIASAPSGIVAGSYSPSGYNAPQLDTSVLAQMLHDSRERKEDRKILREELDIKRQEIERQENRDWQDYIIASENQDIELKRIDEVVRSHVADEEIRKAALDETKRMNLVNETLQRLGLDAKRAERVLQFQKQQDDYQIAMQKIEQEKAKLLQEKDEASRKRRMEYITRLTHTIINGAVRIASSMFGKGGKDSGGSNPIGFFAD